MKLDAQLLGTLGAIVVALLAWLKARDGEKLKAELESKLEAQRNELQRERSVLESELRVSATMRLQLFTEATRAAAEAERFFVQAADEVIDAISEIVRGDDAAAEANLKALMEGFSSGYAGAGLLLPPQLDDVAEKTRRAVLTALTDAWRLRKKDDPRDEGDGIVQDLNDAITRYRDAARGWKTQHWKEWLEA